MSIYKKLVVMKKKILLCVVIVMLCVSACYGDNTKHDFAMDFLRKSMKLYDDENLLVSPLSAEMALSLLSNGAKGQTQSEILEMLGVVKGQQYELNKHYYDLMIGMPNRDGVSVVKMANAVWVDDSFELLNSFEDSSKYYNAMVKAIDLQNPKNAKVINKWASENTNNLINNVADEKMFSPDIRMILANALYFKGKWQIPFDDGMSAERPFHKNNGDVVMVKMMRKTSHYRYIRPEKSDYQVVCLDYKGEAYEMVVVLPDKGKLPEEVVQKISDDSLKDWSENARSKNIYLELPSFKIEWSKSLNDCFREMGMERAFTSNADFTGLSDSERLNISDISQFTYMDVDETGTEAAAVTMISMKCTAVIEKPYPFIVDHPFVLFIRDKQSGEILFEGKIGNPVR